MAYLSRALSHAIVDSGQKIVIVEGARAVGKTAMVQNELVPLGFSYYTLADQATYEIASEDPFFWVNSIEQPAIIDEAQRIKELPLAIKECADKQLAPGTGFILTGSASIGKAGLDGQDPLTRRSQRFTLNPLTQREIRGNKSNLVQDLWTSTPNPDYRSTLSERELVTQMEIGGFPYYVNTSQQAMGIQLSHQIRSDLKNVLGDTLLPDEYLDHAIAWSILSWLLSLPGDILNVNSIGKILDCDNRTIDRYISIFANRFLIRYLPNLRQLPHKQSFTRSKIHPIDTSFSVEVIRERGHDPITDRTTFGKLLESYVVAQIIPDTQWGKYRADAFYWREAGRDPKEVDIVLLHNNEIVGIEVKASTAVSQKDLKGLHALAHDPRLHRGYLVYLGEKPIQFSEKIWAIPLGALWDSTAFRKEPVQREVIALTPSKNTNEEDWQEDTIPALIDANAFLSYSHADNDHLDNAMVELANAIGAEYEFQFGNRLKIFVDKNDLQWGDDWQTEIDRNIEETHFLLPCVTPRYLRSEACREEFLQFLGRTNSNDRCKILSLIWQNPDDTGGQILEEIRSHQYRDVSTLRDLTPQDREYKRIVRQLVEDLHEVITKNSEASTDRKSASVRAKEESENEAAFDEKLDRLMDEIPILENALEELKADFTEISASIESTPFPKTAKGSYTQWGATLAQKTRTPLTNMNHELDTLESVWSNCYGTMADLIRICGYMNQDAGSILPSLYSLRNSFSNDFDFDSALGTVKALPLFSSRLKPLAKSLRRLIDTFKNIEQMTKDLIADAEALSEA